MELLEMAGSIYPVTHTAAIGLCYRRCKTENFGTFKNPAYAISQIVRG
jgi:hypothetical protein